METASRQKTAEAKSDGNFRSALARVLTPTPNEVWFFFGNVVVCYCISSAVLLQSSRPSKSVTVFASLLILTFGFYIWMLYSLLYAFTYGKDVPAHVIGIQAKRVNYLVSICAAILFRLYVDYDSDLNIILISFPFYRHALIRLRYNIINMRVRDELWVALMQSLIYYQPIRNIFIPLLILFGVLSYYQYCICSSNTDRVPLMSSGTVKHYEDPSVKPFYSGIKSFATKSCQSDLEVGRNTNHGSDLAKEEIYVSDSEILYQLAESSSP